MTRERAKELLPVIQAIKPKPREWWFLQFSDGSRSDLIDNREHAECRAFASAARGTKVIHVQEVE